MGSSSQDRIAKKHWEEFLSDVGLLEYQALLPAMSRREL
jgi:hypothetical protein